MARIISENQLSRMVSEAIDKILKDYDPDIEDPDYFDLETLVKYGTPRPHWKSYIEYMNRGREKRRKADMRRGFTDAERHMEKIRDEYLHDYYGK